MNWAQGNGPAKLVCNNTKFFKTMRLPSSIYYVVMLSLLFFLLPVAGCDKKDDMVGKIKVVFANTPEIVVPDARVELYQNDIKIVGYTDNRGVFEFTFRMKMKLNVTAIKDTSTVTNAPALKGVGTIALGEWGEVVEETIYLSN